MASSRELPPAELTRQLTCVQASLGEVLSVANAQPGKWKPSPGFWGEVLSGKPCMVFKPLMHRTLSYWVKFYRHWRDLRRSTRGPSEMMDAEQLRKALSYRPEFIHDLCKMFTSDQITSRTRTRNEVLAPKQLIIAGVLLSGLITTEHKFEVFFGLFDTDQRRSLNQRQFAQFLDAFSQGLCSAFGLPHKERPDPESNRAFAKELFSRIGHVAAERLKQAIAEGSPELRWQVLRMAKQRAETGDVDLSPARIQPLPPPQSQDSTQWIPFATLAEGCMGDVAESEPVALLMHLAFKRWCASRHDIFVDEYSDDGAFRLAEVDVKIEDCSLRGSEEIVQASRAEVLFARRVFDSLTEEISRAGDFPLKTRVREIVESAARHFDVSADARVKLAEVLRRMALECSRETLEALGFFCLLRRVYPTAGPRTLRMFEVWCLEYDTWLESKTQVDGALRAFRENDARPLLPADELARLKREFNRLDYSKSGRISADDLMRELDLAKDVKDEMTLNICSDGYIDEQEFVRIMCPPQFRPHEMAGEGRRMFGVLLAHRASQQREALQSIPGRHGGKLRKRPSLLRPRVDEASWNSWGRVFDKLDNDQNEFVSSKDLAISGLLSEDVSEIVASLVSKEDGLPAFSRRSFLRAMLDAHGFQILDPGGAPV